MSLFDWVLVFGALNAVGVLVVVILRWVDQKTFQQAAQLRLLLLDQFPKFRTDQRNINRDVDDRLKWLNEQWAKLREEFEQLRHNHKTSIEAQWRELSNLDRRLDYLMNQVSEIRGLLARQEPKEPQEPKE